MTLEQEDDDVTLALSAVCSRIVRVVAVDINADASEVEYAYRRLGIRRVRVQARDGRTALTFHASW